MSKKPNRIELPADHPMHGAGFIHELTVMDAVGMSWGTWQRDLRNRIPGRTLSTGRWFHRSQLVEWLKAQRGGADGPQCSAS